jgi:hypothetical protein
MASELMVSLQHANYGGTAALPVLVAQCVSNLDGQDIKEQAARQPASEGGP